jgi:outer membrane cobalamin receptor
MKRLFFIFILFFPFIIKAQQYNISGCVKDEKGKALQNANIIDSKTQQRASADSFGNYNISVSHGMAELSVSYLGYESKKKVFNCNSDTIINFVLTNKDNEIGEVEVIGEKDFEKAISETVISTKIIDKLPSLGGEKDLIKALLLVPGVQPGSEATTGIFVRGGNSDQNLILLDEMPIYNISHLFGYISVFDIDMTENIKIIKAGFPASYGGRLSSVVKLDLKNGQSDSITGIGKVGLVSSKLQVEIPLKKNTYLLVSARKTYFDLFVRMFNAIKTGSGQEYGNYMSFYDLNIRMTSKLYNKNKVFLNYYMGDDITEFVNKFNSGSIKSSDIYKTKSGNKTGSLRYIHAFNTKHSLSFISGFSGYRHIQSFKSETEDTRRNEHTIDYFNEENKIFDIINTLQYSYSNRLINTQIGIQLTNHNYTPFSVSYNENSNIKSETYHPLEAVYFIDNMLHTNRFTINTGLRFTNYFEKDLYFNNLEPRISAKYHFSKNITAKASYTLMHQYNHLLSNISTGMPVDIWFPVTRKSPPPAANQYSFGLSKSNLLKYIDTGLEIYYKSMDNLIDFSDNVVTNPSLSNIEKYIVNDGKGTSYGMELFVRLNTDKLDGAVSYTLSKTDRQFDEINSGKPYPFKYDRRHNFTSFLNIQLSDKVVFSASWIYMSGYALTLPVGRYYTPETTNRASLLLYSERNQYRMPAYHRLDMAVSHEKRKEKGIRIWEISIYNAYNKRNAYYIDIYRESNYNEDTQDLEYSQPKLWQRSLLPIIPSVSYIYKF